MTLYVKTRGARSNNIEIEGTGGHQRGLFKNVPGVIYFANTGVRSIMFSDKNSVFRIRIEICISWYALRVDIYILGARDLKQCAS